MSARNTPAEVRPGTPFLALTGLLGGIFGGLAGGGGGTITVPLLDNFTKMQRVTIHGTSTIANIFIALAGVSFYLWRGGEVDLPACAGMIIGGVIGAPLGAKFARHCSEAWLRGLFILVMAIAAADLIIHALAGAQMQSQALLIAAPGGNSLPVLILAAGLGFLVGAWASAMGLGGGLLAVPALVLLFGVEQHVAEGSSLLIMLPNVISGGIAHIRQGTASAKTGGIIGIAALFGSVFGVMIALHLAAHILTALFATIMVIVIIRDSLIFRRKYLMAK